MSFKVGDTVRWGHGRLKNYKFFVSAIFEDSYKCNISYEVSEKKLRDKLENSEDGWAVYPKKYFIPAKAILTERCKDGF